MERTSFHSVDWSMIAFQRGKHALSFDVQRRKDYKRLPASWYRRSSSTFAAPHFTGLIAESTLLRLAGKVLIPVHRSRTKSVLDEFIDPSVDVRFGDGLDFRLRPTQSDRYGVRCHTRFVTRIPEGARVSLVRRGNPLVFEVQRSVAVITYGSVTGRTSVWLPRIGRLSVGGHPNHRHA